MYSEEKFRLNPPRGRGRKGVKSPPPMDPPGNDQIVWGRLQGKKRNDGEEKNCVFIGERGSVVFLLHFWSPPG